MNSQYSEKKKFGLLVYHLGPLIVCRNKGASMTKITKKYPTNNIHNQNTPTRSTPSNKYLEKIRKFHNQSILYPIQQHTPAKINNPSLKGNTEAAKIANKTLNQATHLNASNPSFKTRKTNSIIPASAI